MYRTLRIGRMFHYRATYFQEWATTLLGPWAGRRAGDLLSHLVDTALWLNGAIREVSGMTKTFHEGRDVDDATWALVRFENGSAGSLEATRYDTGCRNRNGFEMHGQLGMLRFNLEDMNHLEWFDAADPRRLQAPRRLLVTGPDHPYSANFWKPGHTIGYEHIHRRARRFSDVTRGRAILPAGFRGWSASGRGSGRRPALCESGDSNDSRTGLE